jgi:DNA-directed RNA polymerase specialized sigma24 family protein
VPGASLPDHRRSPEGTLLTAIRSGDHLALAEAWQRTAPAAHAVARRLAGPADTEAVLHRLYAELWRSPAITEPLERWARARCFALSLEFLRAEGRGPAAASVGCVMPDLPARRAGALDPVERVLAGLPDDAARALVRAHDQGLPTWTHPEPDAPAALRLALRTLAGAPDGPDPDGAGDHPLGDLALGLLDSAQAEVLQNLLLDTPELAEHARLLRRGSRRMEGLPPAPELGPRILLAVVAGVPAAAPITPPAAPAAPVAAPAAAAPLIRDEDVVITVARPATGEPGRRAERQQAARDEDTGPIAVIDPPAFVDFGESALAPWGDGLPFGGSLPEPAPIDDEPDSAIAAPPALPMSPRRGIGLLLIGTALGMLAGALTLVLR